MNTDELTDKFIRRIYLIGKRNETGLTKEESEEEIKLKAECKKPLDYNIYKLLVVD